MGISMDKTRVDDMLIEMITPKVKQIEEKLATERDYHKMI